MTNTSNGQEGLADGPDGDTPMSFFEHLAELRKRLTRAFAGLLLGTLVCYVYIDEITALMRRPFAVAWKAAEMPGNPTMINVDALEVILADIWIAVMSGLFLASPVVFYQIWMFISPGLYAREKKIVVPFVATSAAMFVAGGAFCYRLVLPIATEFFLKYAAKKSEGGEVPVTTMYAYGDYVNYVMKILVGFGLMFELPLAVFFLAKAGVITHLSLLRHWKIAILGITVTSAILTPPDPVTIWLMGIPMTALYFLSVGVAYLVSKPEIERMKRLDAELAAMPDDGDD